MFSDFSRSFTRAWHILALVVLVALLSPWVALCPADAQPTNTATSSTPVNKATASAESDRLLKLAQQYSTPTPSASTKENVNSATPSMPAASNANAVAAPASAPASTTAAPTSAAYDLPASESKPLGIARTADAPASTPRKQLSEKSWIPSTLAALGVVLGLAMLLKTIITRSSGRSGNAMRNNPIVEVLSRTTVSPKNHVLLLRIGQRILIVNDSPAGMRPLGEITEAEEVASLLTTLEAYKPTSITGNFASILGSMNQQYSDTPAQDLVGTDATEHHVDRARDGLGGLLAKLRITTQENRR